MNRAYSLLTVKAVSEDERIIRGVATTPSPDRVGDIVEPLGVKFTNPMPLLHQHDHDKPVGTVKFDKPTKDGITFEARLPKIDEPGPLKDRVDTAWAEVKAGLVRAVSIGFRALEDGYEFMKEGGIRFLKTEVLELSLVTIPANAQATITAVKSIDSGVRSAIGKVDASTADKAVSPAAKPAPAGVTASTIKHNQPAPRRAAVTLKEVHMAKTTIAEQIAALEAKRAANAARMEEILEKGIEEGRSTEAEEQVEFDELESELKTIDGDIVRLKKVEALKQATAKAVGEPKNEDEAGKVRAGVVVSKAEKLEKGIGFARYAQVLAAAKGDITLAKSIAENRFGNDERLKTIMKAAVEAGTTTDPQWAGALVAHNELATDFIDYLRPRTIIGRFGDGSIPSLRRVPFNVHIKGKTATGTAGWVGEGYAKPVTKSEYNDVYLGWAKVAAISVITEELARFSNPGAESLVRDDLAQAVIERIDTDFIDPAKAAGTGATASPASITNGVTPIPSVGTDGDSVRADIAALWAQADATNLPVSGAVYITDSRTARALSLLRNPLGQKEFPDVTVAGGSVDGVPLIVSNYVPSDAGGSLFILAFAPEIFLADDGVVTLSASREASIQMDDAPTHNSGTPTGAQLVSMFQTNSIALRAERYINWAKRRPQAVAFLEDVNWGVSGS